MNKAQGADTVRFAHSAPGKSFDAWETLRTHAVGVAEVAAAFADAFGFAEAGRASGLLHDIGKCSSAFQSYIRASGDPGRGPNHAYAGALAARERYPGPFGRILSSIIAGHHAGLANGTDLDERLGSGRDDVPPFDGWEAEVGPLPEAAAFRGIVPLRLSFERGFTQAFLTRMLFSCLVDADSLATEAFYATLEDRTVPRGGLTALATLRDRLRAHMAGLGPGAASSEAGSLNRLRARVLDHARSKATEPTGLFTLTVPTGGGKTLTSLSFALDHAIAHGLRRIIYVIPFTGARIETPWLCWLGSHPLVAPSQGRGSKPLLEPPPVGVPGRPLTGARIETTEPSQISAAHGVAPSQGRGHERGLNQPPGGATTTTSGTLEARLDDAERLCRTYPEASAEVLR